MSQDGGGINPSQASARLPHVVRGLGGRWRWWGVPAGNGRIFFFGRNEFRGCYGTHMALHRQSLLAQIPAWGPAQLKGAWSPK